MINQRKGKIEVGGLSIPFKITFEDFLETGISPHIVGSTDDEYKKITTKHDFCSRQLVITFIFDPSNYLYMLILGFWKGSEEPSWKNWSIERERSRKRYHDWFLFKELGFPPYQYSWGRVSSNLNMKTGFSTISILIQSEEAE
jgi:hypothetical protein